MFKKAKANAPQGEPDDTVPAPADRPGNTEADERLAPDAGPTVPDPVVSDTVVSDPDVSDPVVSDPVVSDPVVSRGRAGAAGFDSRGRVRRTRAGAWWAGLIVAALLAVALLIFIAQNSQDATIHYLGFSGQISLAVALLSAAAGGVLLVAIPGAVRMAQLRRALKKNAAAAEKG